MSPTKLNYKCARCSTNVNPHDYVRRGEDDFNFIHLERNGLHAQYNWSRSDEEQIRWEPVDTDIRVCDECIYDSQRMIQTVKEGGIYFMCEECGVDGAVVKGKYAQKLRDEQKASKSNACGVVLEKCIMHGDFKNE